METNPEDLGTFTEEVPHGKIHLCKVFITDFEEEFDSKLKICVMLVTAFFSQSAIMLVDVAAVSFISDLSDVSVHLNFSFAFITEQVFTWFYCRGCKYYFITFRFQTVSKCFDAMLYTASPKLNYFVELIWHYILPLKFCRNSKFSFKNINKYNKYI